MKTFQLIPALLAIIVLASSCAKESFDIRDVDPTQAGTVRSLGPESQDVIRVADLMTRSLLDSPIITDGPQPATIALLPMENNTRHPFNKEIFTVRLRAELNRNGRGALRFIAREEMEAIQAERAAKRAGEVDYDPDRRTLAVAGADFLLKGQVLDLSTASRKGQSDYALYSFQLIDAETGLNLWEDIYEIKKEGRDDVIYR